MTGSRFEIGPDVSNHFAWLRTRMGLERTFMAWMRTAISLIGFGFTIVQFFQHLQDLQGGGPRAIRPGAPRDLGLMLIGVGLVALAIATYQYHQQVRYLWQPQFLSIAGMDEKIHRTPVYLVAGVLLLIGLFAFSTVFFRMF